MGRDFPAFAGIVALLELICRILIEVVFLRFRQCKNLSVFCLEISFSEDTI
jgi:hypothetical protein